MTSSFHQWELDPLFSAAEVVQDSADRMESIFRLLLHEEGLVQGCHSDPKLLTSIEYHKRDLATTLETAKWQLEDFERAVGLSAATDKSRMREDVISRHKQFIRAIREQIVHVEESLVDSSLGNPVRNAEWINLDEQDRDGLALFLSGQDPTERVPRYEKEDSTIMKRFLDPVTTSGYNDSTNEIVEQQTRESEMHLEAPEVQRDVGCIHGGNSSWDVEADGPKDKSFFKEGRGYHIGRSILSFLANLWPACRSRVSRNFTKRLKDGEEQSNSPSGMEVSHAALGRHARMRLAFRHGIFWGLYSELFAKVMHSYSWIGAWRSSYQRSLSHLQVDYRSVGMTLMVLMVLVILDLRQLWKMNTAAQLLVPLSNAQIWLRTVWILFVFLSQVCFIGVHLTAERILAVAGGHPPSLPAMLSSF